MLSYFPSRAQVPTRVPLTRANSFPFPSYLLLLMCSVSICIPGIILFQFMQEKKKKSIMKEMIFQLRLCSSNSDCVLLLLSVSAHSQKKKWMLMP